MPKPDKKKQKTRASGARNGLGGSRIAPLSRAREDRHNIDQERVDNQAPLSNEGREIV